jgi:hypothetical protein
MMISSRGPMLPRAPSRAIHARAPRRLDVFERCCGIAGLERQPHVARCGTLEDAAHRERVPISLQADSRFSRSSSVTVIAGGSQSERSGRTPAQPPSQAQTLRRS